MKSNTHAQNNIDDITQTVAKIISNIKKMEDLGVTDKTKEVKDKAFLLVGKLQMFTSSLPDNNHNDNTLDVSSKEEIIHANTKYTFYSKDKISSKFIYRVDLLNPKHDFSILQNHLQTKSLITLNELDNLSDYDDVRKAVREFGYKDCFAYITHAFYYEKVNLKFTFQNKKKHVCVTKYVSGKDTDKSNDKNSDYWIESDDDLK